MPIRRLTYAGIFLLDGEKQKCCCTACNYVFGGYQHSIFQNIRRWRQELCSVTNLNVESYIFADKNMGKSYIEREALPLYQFCEYLGCDRYYTVPSHRCSEEQAD